MYQSRKCRYQLMSNSQILCSTLRGNTKLDDLTPKTPKSRSRRSKKCGGLLKNVVSTIQWKSGELRLFLHILHLCSSRLTCDIGIIVDARCCLADEPTRRGNIRFVGVIPSLPGLSQAPWTGVALDEPFGKNDGSVHGKRYFQCKDNHGVFVRPERVVPGDYPELGLEEDDPDMEEI